MEDDTRKNIIGIVISLGLSALACFLLFQPMLTNVMPLLASGHEVLALAELVGFALGGGVAVWAIVYFAYVRNRAPELGYTYFLIPFALCLAVYGGYAYIENQGAEDQRAQMQTARREIAVAMNAATDPQGAPVDMTVKSTGEAGEIERAIKALAFDMRAGRIEYQTAIATLGIKTIMLSSNLAKDRGLVRTRANLDAARVALKKFRLLSEGLDADFHRRIAAVTLSDTTRREVIAGFDRSISRFQDERETVWTCDDGILAEYQKMAALLAHPKGRWIAKGDTILFANADDLAAYQDHTNAVRAYRSQELSAVAAIQMGARQTMSEFQEPGQP